MELDGAAATATSARSRSTSCNIISPHGMIGLLGTRALRYPSQPKCKLRQELPDHADPGYFEQGSCRDEPCIAARNRLGCIHPRQPGGSFGQCVGQDSRTNPGDNGGEPRLDPVAPESDAIRRDVAESIPSTKATRTSPRTSASAPATASANEATRRSAS